MRAVTLTKQASKMLAKMPRNQADMIRSKIDQLARAPEELAANITKLTGRPEYRLRVGGWRVIFNEHGEVLAILAISPRGGACD